MINPKNLSSPDVDIVIKSFLWNSNTFSSLESLSVILNCSRRLSMAAVLVGLLSETYVAQASAETLARVQEVWMLH